MSMRHFGGPIQPRKAVEQVVGHRPGLKNAVLDGLGLINRGGTMQKPLGLIILSVVFSAGLLSCGPSDPLNPSLLTKTGDTLREALSRGDVDTRTYNPIAGYEAFLEAKAKAKVKDTERKGLSPDNPLPFDRAYFAAQPKLPELAVDTALRVGVPFYGAIQAKRRSRQ